MDLQLVRIEVPVGPYHADILASDASGAYVVIENQFRKTNHDHLGKLLTYGATLGASAVWIAEDFTEEHLQGGRLAQRADNRDAVPVCGSAGSPQIDDSSPAIRFNVISQPNTVVRAAAVKASGSLTETQHPA
ncbi:MAG: hypothetical protein IPJ18_05180 [Betaproteobacteria bacterium]|nr:hypothetical protein [Betaproteobacteria bacterium]